MRGMVDPAGERIIFNRSAATTKPSQEAPASVRHDFELNWAARLLLNYHCPRSQLSARHQVTDFDLDQITASQFAVDRKIKQRPVSKSVLAIQMKPNSPYLSRFQRTLGPDLSAGIPRWTRRRIIEFRPSHNHSPVAQMAMGETFEADEANCR
jgi:hypothetical protein